MVTLVVRRTIRAPADRLFAAWTDPAELKVWWGPQGVKCIAAEVDLRIGGHYRIGNELPGGNVLWITGQFEIIERPRKLVFTWRVETESAASEKVTVQFEAQGDSTEVIVTHERIRSKGLRDQHETGWRGCLDGLANHAEA